MGRYFVPRPWEGQDITDLPRTIDRRKAAEALEATAYWAAELSFRLERPLEDVGEDAARTEARRQVRSIGPEVVVALSYLAGQRDEDFDREDSFWAVRSQILLRAAATLCSLCDAADGGSPDYEMIGSRAEMVSYSTEDLLK